METSRRVICFRHIFPFIDNFLIKYKIMLGVDCKASLSSTQISKLWNFYRNDYYAIQKNDDGYLEMISGFVQIYS